MTMTLLASSTFRMGIPVTELPGLRAAGLVTSFAPTTSTTSVRLNSGLASSKSFIW